MQVGSGLVVQDALKEAKLRSRMLVNQNKKLYKTQQLLSTLSSGGSQHSTPSPEPERRRIQSSSSGCHIEDFSSARESGIQHVI